MGLRKVGNVDVFLDAEGLVQSIQLAGRSLYLTSDPDISRLYYSAPAQRAKQKRPQPIVVVIAIRIRFDDRVRRDMVVKLSHRRDGIQDLAPKLLSKKCRIGSQIQSSAGKLNGLDQSLSVEKDIDVSDFTKAHIKTVSGS